MSYRAGISVPLPTGHKEFPRLDEMRRLDALLTARVGPPDGFGAGFGERDLGWYRETEHEARFVVARAIEVATEAGFEGAYGYIQEPLPSCKIIYDTRWDAC